RRLTALAGAVVCLFALTALALTVPPGEQEEFYDENYVSKFARSGVTAMVDLWTRGIMESEAAVTDRLRSAAGYSCTARKRPHIVMVFDESSFDISTIAGVKVPPDYGRHFRSFDGKARAFVVEAA